MNRNISLALASGAVALSCWGGALPSDDSRYDAYRPIVADEQMPPAARMFKYVSVRFALDAMPEPYAEQMLWRDGETELSVVLNAWGKFIPLLRLPTKGKARQLCIGPSAEVTPGRETDVSFMLDAHNIVQWTFGRQRADLRPGGDRKLESRLKSGDQKVRVIGTTVVPCRRDELGVACVGRRAFVRGETNAFTRIRVTNESCSDLELVRVTGVADGGPRPLPRGASADFTVPVETRVRCGTHDVRVSAEARGTNGLVYNRSKAFPIGVGSVENDGLMRLMWHSNDKPSEIAQFGFTAFSRSTVGLQKLTDPPQVRQRTDDLLDESLLAGISVIQRLQQVQVPEGRDPADFALVDRYGKTRKHGTAGRIPPDVGRPELVEVARRLSVTNATLFGRHPALAAVLPYSERRDGSFPAFNGQNERYTNETGRAVPPRVSNKWMMNAKFVRERFPDGVVPEDDEYLSYYRWFWAGGDGWPAYISRATEAYMDTGVHDGLFSLWDPGVRCPPIWGSGGSVDVLGQWVYPTPEPMAVAGVAEGLQAMAEGRPGQKIGLMTQIVCYRRRVAPTNEVVNPMPAWTSAKGADYMVPLSPDMLQEAVWSMIAKPVMGISFFGQEAADPNNAMSTPELRERMRYLMQDVVAPLGSTLKRLGRARSKVAVLDSFTSCIMGCSAGWGWSAPPVTFAQRARLDPRVIYEETILRDGLDDVKVLYAPECAYLPAEIVRRIADFQAKGGVLVADTNLVSVLKPDIVVPTVSFERPPASDSAEDVDANEAALASRGKSHENTLRLKRHMTKGAEALRKALAASYVPPADSSSPEIVVFGRHAGSADYLFALNDKRTFGDWFGPWGRVMDKGLPMSGWVSQADPEGRVAAVYELSRGGAVAFERVNGTARVPVSFETNDGRLFAFLPQKIARLDVSAPKTVRRGQKFEAMVSVLDAAGAPVRAHLPVEVRLVEPGGRTVDGGWRCAEDGVCRVSLLVDADISTTNLKLIVRDRASGLGASQTLALAVPASAGFDIAPLDRGPDRNPSPLTVEMARIGTIRPRSANEISGSRWTIDCGTLDRGFTDFDAYKDYLVPLGIKEIRLLAGWARCEREPGKFDFAWLDHCVDWAKANGLNVYLDLSYGNPIYKGAGTAGLAGGIPNTSEGLSHWDGWIRTLGEHYKGRIRDYAMWNEPDNGGLNPPAAIAAFNVRTARILKEIMPDCRLHGLSLASNLPERFESCLSEIVKIGGAGLFDTYVYHGYAYNPDSSYERIEKLKEICRKYAPHATMRQGENGCISEYSDRFALAYHPWSETSQAKWDMRRMLGDLGHDCNSTLFTICDMYYAPPHAPYRYMNRKGILRANEDHQVIAVKKAYYAVQNLVALFDDSLSLVKDRRVSTYDRTLSLYEYEKNGLPLFAFWDHGLLQVDFRRRFVDDGTGRMKKTGQIEDVHVQELDMHYDVDEKDENFWRIAARGGRDGVPSDSFETRPAVFNWTGAPIGDPVWIDLFTGAVYAFPAKQQIRHSTGVSFVRVPVYDSPCVLTDRSLVALQ